MAEASHWKPSQTLPQVSLSMADGDLYLPLSHSGTEGTTLGELCECFWGIIQSQGHLGTLKYAAGAKSKVSLRDCVLRLCMLASSGYLEFKK